MTTYYVCKMCGRSMNSEKEVPKFCYFDCMESVENISEEDAEKMGLKKGISFLSIGENVYFEFPGDVKFNPFFGNRIHPIILENLTLSKYQDEIMEGVRK